MSDVFYDGWGWIADLICEIVGAITQHQPFEVIIKSRGPMFSKIIKEANITAQSGMEHLVLNTRYVMNAK